MEIRAQETLGEEEEEEEEEDNGCGGAAAEEEKEKVNYNDYNPFLERTPERICILRIIIKNPDHKETDTSIHIPAYWQ